MRLAVFISNYILGAIYICILVNSIGFDQETALGCVMILVPIVITLIYMHKTK